MPGRKTARAGAYLKLIRPKQWIKNLFVFAPLIFAKELFDAGPVIAAVEAFVAFCLAASAVYVINDIADVEADRLHPVKRHRPIAAGAVSATEAYLLIAMLLVGASLAAYAMDSLFQLILAGYVAMNVAYSFRLKHIVLLDVFIVAAGFMMRVLGGAYAIRVETSTWLVLCTLFISLFLGFAKRRGELVVIEDAAYPERKVLQLYRVEFLDQMLTIAAAGTVISYALYTVAPRTLIVFGTDKLIYTTVFVIYGIFRYLYLIHTTRSTDNPTNAITSDWPILITATLWVISCVLLIYFGVQPA
ncbi:MAG: decaprenyl-phosphate phosphoribosyltransferase [Ignavibacteriae bacterium]|nr:decaprenyl-phosphate phosphoribosyltransferase [Ignavibacteriota bacterium]